MTTPDSQLPWDALGRTERGIPWDALEQFADALAADPELWRELRGRYDDFIDHLDERRSCEGLLVPAILAMAAPRLDDATREDMARFLLDALIEAGDLNEDTLCEALLGAAGSLGTPLLRPLLAALEREGELGGGWYHVWSLTAVAVDCGDAELRARVAERCLDALRRGCRSELEADLVPFAARTLALLGRHEARPLMQRAAELSHFDDFEEAVAILDGTHDPSEFHELWETPVREWLERRWEWWRGTHHALDRGEAGDDEDDEDLELGDELADDYVEAFLDSPRAEALPEAAREAAGLVVDVLVSYAHDYCGVAPDQYNEQTLREVLLEILPRKVTADRDTFEQVAPVAQAFLCWLDDEGELRNGGALARTVGRWAGQIVAEALDPDNWGMAKSLAMRMEAEGVDITDPAARRRFTDDYNRRIAGRSLDELDAEPENPAPSRAGPLDVGPARPVHVERKAGRNDPCPCGSGRKYKRCCGR